MNSFSPELSLIIGVFALLIALYCLWQTVSLNRLRKTFFMGSRGADLESVIQILQQESRSSQSQQAVLETALAQLAEDLSFTVQKVGLVRFNPFEDGGGNFSFALALLDAHNSGIVLTSMYGREQSRIYTKKILNATSDAKLSEEEHRAVIEAQQKQTTGKTKH